MMLTKIMVVIGKNSFKFGRLITMSPGSRPMGSLPSQGHSKPTITKTTPTVIRIFCMTGQLRTQTEDLQSYPPPLGQISEQSHTKYIIHVVLKVHRFLKLEIVLRRCFFESMHIEG